MDRVEGDYPRVVALDAPRLRPHAGMEDIRKYSQHDVDVLSIEGNKRDTVPLNDISFEKQDAVMNLIGIGDQETLGRMRKLGMDGSRAWVLC